MSIVAGLAVLMCRPLAAEQSRRASVAAAA
jgi:hypothetical protein